MDKNLFNPQAKPWCCPCPAHVFRVALLAGPDGRAGRGVVHFLWRASASSPRSRRRRSSLGCGSRQWPGTQSTEPQGILTNPHRAPVTSGCAPPGSAPPRPLNPGVTRVRFRGPGQAGQPGGRVQITMGCQPSLVVASASLRPRETERAFDYALRATERPHPSRTLSHSHAALGRAEFLMRSRGAPGWAGN